jgi:hypothetical protein
MKPLRTERNWPQIAVYDIEAEQWVNVAIVCHVDEYGNRKVFPNVRSYVDWLFHDFEGDHVWAHWGGHYDHRFVIHEATLRGWDWETIQSGGLIVLVKVQHRTGRVIHFCDSARLMPGSVEKIGKTVGLPKLDVDRSHIEKLTISEMVEYCFRDCDIVVRGLQHMRDTLTEVGADFAYTLASIASRWVRRSEVLDWRRFFDDAECKEYLPDMLHADAFCMPAYFGGRVECFRVGRFDGPLYYYDIRSSYPWSMTQELPAYPDQIRVTTDLDVLNLPGISEATVHVPHRTYVPLLPVRKKGKLIFPVGTLHGRWTHLELTAAMERGARVELHKSATFESASFLRPFVSTFFDLRKAAISDDDSFRSYAYKICLNSLYGKLVETVDRKSTIHGRKAYNRAKAVHGIESIYPTSAPGIYSIRSQQEGPFRHVAAGAYVTARSRLRLLAGLEAALHKGGRVFYCDTDSIITDVELDPEPDLLGHFKLEAKLAELETVCPKVYRAVTSEGAVIHKVKGMPVRGLSPEQTEERFRSYVEGRAVTRDGISGFASDISHGRIAPRAQVLSRALRNPDSKRVHRDGDSLPLVLGEGEQPNE